MICVCCDKETDAEVCEPYCIPCGLYIEKVQEKKQDRIDELYKENLNLKLRMEARDNVIDLLKEAKEQLSDRGQSDNNKKVSK